MYFMKEILLSSVLLMLCDGIVSGSVPSQMLSATGIPQVITSPGYPIKYSPNALWRWKITSHDAEKVVVIETVDLLLPGTNFAKMSKCQDDVLLVFNGPDMTNSRGHWTLCGQDRRMLISTGRFMYLVFFSDAKYETRGFKLRYYQASASAPCNRDFLATRVGLTFSSPGYPGGYYSHLKCNYTIRAEIPTDRVEIKLIDSDIEDAISCQYDNLTLVDQNSGTERVLGTICGTETPTYQSSGNSLMVKFVSNNLKVNKGFQIQYKAVDRRYCSVSLEATRMNSFLVSPGYPQHYYSNLTCNWGIFSPDVNRSVVVSTIKSNISGLYPNCSGDKVEVSEMNTTERNFTFCGSQTPSFQIRRLGWISLHTDSETEAQGFVMRYRLLMEDLPFLPCNGTLKVNSSKQRLASPLYPKHLLAKQKCQWTLTSDHDDDIIIISLSDLDIEMSTNCQFDSLEIHDANSARDDKVLETWCGQRGGEVIYSTGKYLTVVYKVDDSNNGRGFSLTYSAAKASALVNRPFQLNATDEVSYLTSPGFSNYAPRNRQFSYLFVADDGHQIKLEVLISNLPWTSGNCSGHTRGIVYDGPTDKSPVLASINTQTFSWCGTDLPVYVSTNNHMLLVYHIESLGNKNVGFELTYKQGSFKNLRGFECGGWLQATSDHKNITSPNYPRLFLHDMKCRWTIRTSTNGSVIRLIGQDVNVGMSFSGACHFGSLTLYDGAESDENKLDTWCGKMTQTIQTTGDFLTIVFQTNGTILKSGFNMQVFETTEMLPCEQSLTVIDMLYQTVYPGYDQHILKPNTTCKWILSKNNRTYHRYVEVTLKSLAVAEINKDTCSSYHVDVYDGLSENSPLIGRYCGGDEIIFIGSGDQMFVKMVTGPAPNARGFAIEYVTTPLSPCGDEELTVHNSTRILTSPYYPHEYPNNLDCVWRMISNDFNYIIMVEVVSTDMDESEGCRRDYIEVYDGYDTASPSGKWCGTETPKYQSSGERFTVKFHTDSAGSRIGFKLKYWRQYHVSLVHDAHSNVGPIIGGIIGGLLLAMLLIVLVVCWVRRKSPSKDSVDSLTTKKNLKGEYGNRSTEEIQSYRPTSSAITPVPIGRKHAVPKTSNFDSRKGHPRQCGNNRRRKEYGETMSEHHSIENNEGTSVIEYSSYL